MCKNMVELDRSQMTVRPMRIACCITKATDTHSEYVLLTVLPLQQWLGERCTHIACLIVRSWGRVLRHRLVELTRSIWTDGRSACLCCWTVGVAVVICGYNWWWFVAGVVVLCSDLCTTWKCVVSPTLAGICPLHLQRVEVGWEVVYLVR